MQWYSNSCFGLPSPISCIPGTYIVIRISLALTALSPIFYARRCSSPRFEILVPDRANPKFSLLHIWAFWKQLMARYKASWLASLPKEQCARCGYSEDQAEPTTPHQHSTGQCSNMFTYAGPSAGFRQANILTPECPESVMEEGLLIGSDIGSGYGSIERPEPTLDQPAEVVVGKGKKKKNSHTGSGKAAGKKPEN